MAHRVLLVDDDIAEITAVKRALLRAGAQAHLATNATDAWRALESGGLALAVVAVDCENGEGLQLARRLAADERTRSLPVLLLGEPEEEVPGRVLPRPVDAAQLAGELRAILEQLATPAPIAGASAFLELEEPLPVEAGEAEERRKAAEALRARAEELRRAGAGERARREAEARRRREEEEAIDRERTEAEEAGRAEAARQAEAALAELAEEALAAQQPGEAEEPEEERSPEEARRADLEEQLRRLADAARRVQDERRIALTPLPFPRPSDLPPPPAPTPVPFPVPVQARAPVPTPVPEAAPVADAAPAAVPVAAAVPDAVPDAVPAAAAAAAAEPDPAPTPTPEPLREEMEARRRAAVAARARQRAEPPAAEREALAPPRPAARAHRAATEHEEPEPPPPLPLELAAGSLDQVSPARLLARVAFHRLGGRLDFTGSAPRSLYLEDGRIAGATSGAPGERVEEVALRLGLITREQLRAAAPACAGLPSRRAAVTLIELGFLRPEELTGLVRARAEEVVFALFGEPGATWRHASARAPGEERTALERGPLALAVEGVRRRWQGGRLAAILGGAGTLLGPAPRPPPAEELRLTGPERRVAELADGLRAMEEVLADSPLDSLSSRQLLAALVEVGTLEVRYRAAPAGVPQARLDLARLAEKLDQVRRADYFTILGLSRGATPYEIRGSADRLLAELDAPRWALLEEPGLDDRIAEVRRVVAEARDVLADDELREAYLAGLE